MQHFHIPIIESLEQSAPLWYREFHSQFYISQLINHALLFYMDTEIFHITGSHPDNNKDLANQDVIQCINEVIKNFSLRQKEQQETLLCMGVGLVGDGLINRDMDIDLDQLSSSLVDQNWHNIVKGYLNVWEFQFLFSITESTLKNVLGRNDDKGQIKSKKIIKHFNEKFPELFDFIEANVNLDFNYSTNVWEFYNKIRNLYSHSHGFYRNENDGDLINSIPKFRAAFDSFNRKDFLMGSISLKGGELFDCSEFQEGKFYLIKDNELNIFRNFIAEFMSSIAKYEPLSIKST